jgi:parallel beta-helix repeat protein
MPDRVGRYFMLLTLFIFLLASVTIRTPLADLQDIATQSAIMISELEKQGMVIALTPHDAIEIDGDADFEATALQEGWPGDGSPSNPYIINGLDIDLGGAYGPCIRIDNTTVSFIIRNCKLTGSWTGVFLNHVTNGELVNNIFAGNTYGLLIEYSNNCTMTDNTCTNNFEGISFEDAFCNTVANNTCSNNNNRGIELHDSNHNIFSNNTCTNNVRGISLRQSDFNMIFNNTCNNNMDGIYLHDSDSNMMANNTCNDNGGSGIHLEYVANGVLVNNTCNSNFESGIALLSSTDNTVAKNTCSNNRIGIHLYDSDSNTVTNNTCLNNTEHDIFEEFTSEVTEPEVTEPAATEPEVTELVVTESEHFGTIVLFLIGFVGTSLLGAGWWKVSSRVGEDEIIVPARYRLVSWFRRRRALQDVVVDEALEPDSSDN